MSCLPPLCSSSSIDEDIIDSSVLPSSTEHWDEEDIIINDIAGETMDEVNNSGDLIVEDISGALNNTLLMFPG